MSSPYKTIDVDVNLPEIGQLVAKAYVENGVVKSEDGMLPGVVDVKFPVDAFNKGVDLEQLAKELMFDLNSLTPAGVNKPQYTLNEAHKVAIKPGAVYQVVDQNKMLEAGVFDIHDSAILTQDNNAAYEGLAQLHSGYNVVDVMKELHQFSPKEMSRISNDQNFVVAQAKVLNALERYGFKSHSRVYDCDELVKQQVRDLPRDFQDEIERAFTGNRTVQQAFELMASSNILNPKPKVDPFESVGNENTLYVSFKQDVANTELGYQLTDKRTGVVVSPELNKQEPVEAEFGDNSPSYLPRI